MSMTLEEAIKLLKQYQGYEPMFPDGETLKHAFDLTDETVDTLLTALRPVSREQVEKVWRGKWELVRRMAASIECKCPKCQQTVIFTGKPANFCEKCGSANTDEAVEMVMERMEKLHEDNGCS